MKMQKKIVSAALLLIVVTTAAGGLAVPAQAKHEMYVFMWGVWAGQSLVREIPTGTFADIFWGWMCWTEEQCEDFLDSIAFTWTIDGEPVDYEIIWGEIEIPFDPFVAAFVEFHCYWHPVPPGEYYAELEVLWTKNHFDGWDWYGPDHPETELPPGERTILVTPRDLYPQDPPEELF